MAEIKKGMLKASTLLEAIVAMVIILVIFTLAIGISSNVLSASPSIKKQQAQAMADGLIASSISEENWNDEQMTKDDVVLEKTVLPYGSYSDLVVITVTASQQGKQLSQLRQIAKKSSHE